MGGRTVDTLDGLIFGVVVLLPILLVTLLGGLLCPPVWVLSGVVVLIWARTVMRFYMENEDEV